MLGVLGDGILEWWVVSVLPSNISPMQVYLIGCPTMGGGGCFDVGGGVALM